MGSQQSSLDDYEDAFPVAPIIQKIRYTLKLTITHNKTSSFINQNFSEQLKKTSSAVSRNANPFCPIFIHKNQKKKKNSSNQAQQSIEHWLSCCLISPVMAIASPQHLVDKDDKYCVKAYIQGMDGKGNIIEIGIHSIQVVEEKAICLILLEKPVIELGWAGVTCLASQQQITNESFKIINHPKFEIDQKSQKNIFHQEITKAFYRLEEQFVGSFKAMPGSLIVKVIDKKPYLVGVQVSQIQGHFFTNEILEVLSQAAKKILGKNKEMEIIKMIDIQELQFMEKL